MADLKGPTAPGGDTFSKASTKSNVSLKAGEHSTGGDSTGDDNKHFSTIHQGKHVNDVSSVERVVGGAGSMESNLEAADDSKQADAPDQPSETADIVGDAGIVGSGANNTPAASSRGNATPASRASGEAPTQATGSTATAASPTSSGGGSNPKSVSGAVPSEFDTSTTASTDEGSQNTTETTTTSASANESTPVVNSLPDDFNNEFVIPTEPTTTTTTPTTTPPEPAAPMAQAPSLTAENNAGTEAQSIPIDVSAALNDSDSGNETLSVTINGVPDGSSFSAGTDNGDGSWTFTPEQLDGLTFNPPIGIDTYTFNVTATATEATGDSTSTNAAFDIGVSASGSTIIGTNADETLNGTIYSDVIEGKGGDDKIYGNSGDDTIIGDGGDDKLYGQEGDDTITGGTGDDRMYGGEGDDTFLVKGSEAENDTIQGNEGYDKIVNTGSSDITFDKFTTGQSIEEIDAAGKNIKGNNDSNTLDFSNTILTNVNEIRAGGDNDTVRGSQGDDTILGDGGDDKLYGNAGNDTITGGTGDDKMYGGEGDDTFLVKGSEAENDTIQGDEGYDKIVNTGSSDITFDKFTTGQSIEEIDAAGKDIKGNNDNNTLDFSDTILTNVNEISAGGGNDTVRGSQGDDTILGDGGNDKLYGNAGYDTILGGSGDDKMYGDAGDDVITGGQGADQYYGGEGDDTFYIKGSEDVDSSFHGDEGYDSIVNYGSSNVTFDNFNAANSSIEKLDMGGKDILGTNDNNTLDFRDATLTNVDEIQAGGGNDTVYGSDDDNTIKGEGGNDKLYGEGGDDTLYGDSGDDRLYGGTGDDMITGGSGKDKYYGDEGDDIFRIKGSDDEQSTFSGGEGHDTLENYGSSDVTLKSFNAIDSSIEEINMGGKDIKGTSANNTLDFRGATLTDVSEIRGEAGNDKIYGSSGDDTIRGGSGNDRIEGGAGDDMLYGDQGNDTFLFDYDNASNQIGNDTIEGGNGASWTSDTLKISGLSEGPGGGSNWTLTVNGENISDVSGSKLNLDQDSSGTISFDNGESITFTGVEKIDWS